MKSDSTYVQTQKPKSNQNCISSVSYQQIIYKGYGKKRQRVCFVLSARKEKRNKCSAQNAKRFWAMPRLYGPVVNRDRRYCEREKKKRRKACHHIVAQFLEAYSPHAVGFCALSVVGPGMVSPGLKTSSSFAAAGCVKLGIENKPPPALVVLSSVVCSLV